MTSSASIWTSTAVIFLECAERALGAHVDATTGMVGVPRGHVTWVRPVHQY